MMELKDREPKWKKKQEKIDDDFEFYTNKKYHLSL